jgi:hypothetical protein
MFRTRQDFDCGSFINAWSIFIVRPDGQHISGLQFAVTDEEMAKQVCEGMNKKLEAMIAETVDMMKVNDLSHQDAYKELQDFWIPEDECNSDDFEAVYGRMSLTEIRETVRKYRAKVVYNVVD